MACYIHFLICNLPDQQQQKLKPPSFVILPGVFCVELSEPWDWQPSVRVAIPIHSAVAPRCQISPQNSRTVQPPRQRVLGDLIQFAFHPQTAAKWLLLESCLGKHYQSTLFFECIYFRKKYLRI